jgi:hypothetical protein
MNEEKEKIGLMEVLTGSGMEEKSARMIINKLFEGGKEVDLKSHLSEKETLTFAQASFFASEFRNDKFASVGNLIDLFNDHFLRKRVSYNRMSRIEFVQGVISEIQQRIQEERTKVEKLIR